MTDPLDASKCDEHPNAEDWRNRAEAAEQRLAEHLATCDAFPLATALGMAQRRIEALEASLKLALAAASAGAEPDR